jgi:ATP/ADP translocase
MRSVIRSFYRSATGQAVLLFLYLFLVMTSYIVGKVSRDALFLDQFKAIQLPYADIAIAVRVGFVIALYVRAGRFFRMHTLLILSLAAYVLTCVAFWWTATNYQFGWLYPVVYIWIGIFGVLATAQVWTLANYVFTTREAKSSFSVIGSGAISGAIAGGYVAKAFAGRFGAESLLLVMAAALAISIGLVMLIWNARGQETLAEPERAERNQSGLVRQLHGLWASPHLRSIAILICLSSFATTTASWQFKAIAKQAIPTTAELAAFFGEFNFYAAILALLVQMVLTSRLLKRYGIGPALLLVPVALLVGSTGVILVGTLAAAVILKGVDQVFRYSVDKSSMELLYLPVPSGIKIQAKSFIDTVVWRMGDGLAGVGVLIAANYFHATPRTVGWVTLGAVALWVSVALVARKTYVSSLRDIVQAWRARAEEPAAATAAPVFAAAASPEAFGDDESLSLALLDRLDHPELGAAAANAIAGLGDSMVGTLRDRLADSSSRLHLRLAIVDVLGRIGTPSAERTLELSLLDPDPQVRQRVTAALQSTLRRNPELRADRAKIAAALALEIAHHYRSYQVLPQLCEITSRFPGRCTQLRETMEQEAERIFRLLGVLYPDGDLDSAYAAIRSQVPAVRDSALELLDNTLDPQLRRFLLPLFDESLTARQRARIATRLLGEMSGEPKQLVWTLAHGDDSWRSGSGLLGARGLRLAYAYQALPRRAGAILRSHGPLSGAFARLFAA